ncbi:CD225/dispanin family protein [Chamaesiphon sp. VAR_69_metabat_338]|uniref:CD225/dispanin family protein n=1 Tax=Chamaesiphon sp. VAR_69_metabat_338 TaxID=2964704 RepID=UPI00286D8CB7|nr:CD225/dispanin family protein [Chamaesiphon sp. VAR_69_metabat_338]
MTPLPSSLEPTAEVDAQTIAAALNRKLKSQSIFATVKFDSELEISLSGLAIPNPQQMTKVVAQVLGELQLPAQTVKVCGQQTEATEPNWERDVEIEPIAKVAATRVPDAAPDIAADVEPVLLPCPENNMTLAILATVLGVLPLGIVAISYASQVSSKYAAGNTSIATKYANNAKRLSIISLSVSGVTTGLIVLAIILPVFLGGGFRSTLKQEKAAQKYAQTVLKAKGDELVTANMNNNNAVVSTDLNLSPPTDSGYTFTGEILPDTGSHRNNFKIIATPNHRNLHSFVGFVYTIEQGDKWFVKTDGCISKSTSLFPPAVTIANGTATCDANSKLASESE